jgi:hypothetical protein
MRKVGLQHNVPAPLAATREDRTANLKLIPGILPKLVKRFPTSIGLMVPLELCCALWIDTAFMV